jgi:hypothetical protein
MLHPGSEERTRQLRDLLGELRPILVGLDTGASTQERRAAEARFERVRAEAVSLCGGLRGAAVAAMQMDSAHCDSRGVTRLIELLEAVERDVDSDDDAA